MKRAELIPSLMIIAMVFVMGCVSSHTNARSSSVKPLVCPSGSDVKALNDSENVGTSGHTYLLAVNLFRKELERVKHLYHEAIIKKGSTALNGFSVLSEEILSNSTVINRSVIGVGNETYGYVLLLLQDKRCGVNFRPESINVSGLHVHRLPLNFTSRTRTYTGIPYTTYSVRVGTSGKSCRVYFYDLTVLSAPSVTVGGVTLMATGGWLHYDGACGGIGELSFRFYSGGEDVTVYLLLFRKS